MINRIRYFMFQFQTGSIKSISLTFPYRRKLRFNSKLVRLKVADDIYTTGATMTFQFQTGSIKRSSKNSESVKSSSFNSKLVRLKGFMKTVNILYAILMVRVKLIFRISIFRGGLLSTSGCANSLGGWQYQTRCGFIALIAWNVRICHPLKMDIGVRSTAIVGLYFVRKFACNNVNLITGLTQNRGIMSDLT